MSVPDQMDLRTGLRLAITGQEPVTFAADSMRQQGRNSKLSQYAFRCPSEDKVAYTRVAEAAHSKKLCAFADRSVLKHLRYLLTFKPQVDGRGGVTAPFKRGREGIGDAAASERILLMDGQHRYGKSSNVHWPLYLKRDRAGSLMTATPQG